MPSNRTISSEGRRILVAVSGLTPQIVTETIYALAMRHPPWLPTEVHLLTTTTGAALARLRLLDERNGHFHRLCSDYELSGIDFDVERVHVMHDAQGRPLDDIRSPADTMAMADAILAHIADLASDPASELHVSLAGGRKSMGFFAGYALSLYGRAQDRLSHVLVSPGFETHPAFYFPPRVATVLTGREGEPLNTADARIDLAEIPFVRLRDSLPPELLSGGRFADAVAAAQQFNRPRLVIRLRERQLNCGNSPVRLSPVNFAVYAWHVTRLTSLPEPDVELSLFNAVNSPLRNELHTFGQRLYPNPLSAEAEAWESVAWHDERTDFSQWLSERRTRINSSIRHALGRAGAKLYGIASEATRGRSSRHRLRLPEEAIEVVE